MKIIPQNIGNLEQKETKLTKVSKNFAAARGKTLGLPLSSVRPELIPFASIRLIRGQTFPPIRAICVIRGSPRSLLVFIRVH